MELPHRSALPVVRPSERSQLWSMPGRLVTAYAVVAGLWILGSDFVLMGWAGSPELNRWAPSIKGLVFVGVTATLLYFLLRRWAVQVEQEQRERLEAESAFRTVVDSAPDAIFVETEGRYAFLNEATLRLVGATSPDQVLGQAVVDHVPVEIRDVSREAMARLHREGGVLGPSEGAVLRMDRKRTPVEVTAVAIEYRGKSATLVFARDVSLRVTREALRREQQELLQAVLRSTSDAIFVKDLTYRYLLVNPSGAEVLGKPVEEILGRRNEDLLEARVAAMLAASDRQVIEEQLRCVFDVPLEVRGRLRHFLVTKEPMRDASGRLTGLVGVARDMTEQVEAEALLRRVSGSFLRLQDDERRRIARELHDTTAQSLVAVNLGLAEALRSAVDGTEGLEKSLEECRALVDECIREVRTLSYGLHPPLLDEMGLPTALEEYVREMGKRSGLRLGFSCLGEMGRLPQEAEVAFFRVAQEAVLNVLRHSGSATAHVTLREESGHTELEVRDAGRGIPAERLEEVRRGMSMGVGISGMRERLRQLGGELEISSDGTGTRVRARLPSERVA